MTTEPLPTQIAWSRLGVLSLYYGLIAYFAVNSFDSLGEVSLATIVIWFIQIVPLLLFYYGLHKTHLRTYAWMCFVVMLYFIHAVLLAFDPERRWLGIVEVTLCTFLFVSLIVFIRQYRQHFQVSL